MKTRMITAVCSAALLAGALPLAATQANVDALKKDFATVRPLELPSRTASVVSGAQAADRNSVAEDAVRAAVAVNPAAAPMVVGAVARANGEAAPVSAVTAVSLQPKQLSQITRSAVGGAPAQVQSIVAALTKAQPASFYTIGASAVDVAPKAGEQILSGIASATPALKTIIARATPKGASLDKASTVIDVLKRAQGMVATLSKSGNADTLLAGELTAAQAAALPTSGGIRAAGPPTGAPYAPIATTPGEVTTTQPLAPGTPRATDYSAP